MNIYSKTGFCILCSLVFYFLVAGCAEKEDSASISIQWESNKAVAIVVPQKFLLSVSGDSVKELLHIRLANSDIPVLGDYLFKNDEVIFKPIIAFTRGLKYKVYVRNELVDEIEIQRDNSITAPEVISVYPVLDTLPENLLKFYISFSKPMQEGDAVGRIHLVKDEYDTLSSVFTELELWNNERTLLTLWLNPGRIKRNLQPNKLMGPPLNKGSHYQLVIDKDWQDAQGILLKQTFIRNFFTGTRDSVSPDEKTWTIDVPGGNTKEELIISFHESLDHVLVENTLSVADANGNEVKGKLRVNKDGTLSYFLPVIEWQPGIYFLHIESRLEDLAGNNLDRLFDTDLTKKQKPSKSIHKRQFEIR